MNTNVTTDGADVKFNSAGNLILSDQQNNVIRMVNMSTGIITTIVGNYGSGGGYSGDNGQATAAQLNLPGGLALDASGNIYFCDYGNNVLRKVDHSSNIITTVAGTYLSSAASGDSGPATAASIGTPLSIAFDATGNYYISDNTNNVVRKVNISTGTISTVAGGGTGSEVGVQATTIGLTLPDGILVDAAGNLYICNAGPIGASANEVLKVNSSGIVTVFAGNGSTSPTTDGVVCTSTAVRPRGITKDAAGNFYIATADETIRKINGTTNIISTVVGNGTPGWSGDGGAATAAEIGWCNHVAISSAGDLYFDDDVNMRIRKVNTGSVLQTTNVTENFFGINISPNPSNGSVTVSIASAIDEQVQLSVTNLTGQKVAGLTARTNSAIQIKLNASPGIYFIEAVTENRRVNGKVVIE